jgi:uncharacterized protein YndB with AHSA1/START domain
MVHAQRTVVVGRPIESVFAFLADGSNNPKWRPDVIEIRLASGLGLGAEYHQTMKGPGGRRIRGDYRITRFDHPTRLDFVVTAGPARPTGSFELRTLGASSTEVTFTLDLKARGLMVLMARMIDRQVATEVGNIATLPGAMED